MKRPTPDSRAAHGGLGANVPLSVGAHGPSAASPSANDSDHGPTIDRFARSCAIGAAWSNVVQPVGERRRADAVGVWVVPHAATPAMIRRRTIAATQVVSHAAVRGTGGRRAAGPWPEGGAGRRRAPPAPSSYAGRRPCGILLRFPGSYRRAPIRGRVRARRSRRGDPDGASRRPSRESSRNGSSVSEVISGGSSPNPVPSRLSQTELNPAGRAALASR